jgi:hypothetical protein
VSVEWTQAAAIIFAVAVFTSLQALWISRARDRVHGALDRLDARLDRIEGVVLRDFSERISRLEAAHGN